MDDPIPADARLASWDLGPHPAHLTIYWRHADSDRTGHATFVATEAWTPAAIQAMIGGTGLGHPETRESWGQRAAAVVCSGIDGASHAGKVAAAAWDALRDTLNPTATVGAA